ncbi:MAG TPA: hypothetical protein DCE61_04455 [Cellvibrionales bacterium]|nr:hypothetical protein [Cellvibrionales bacterium]
MGGDARNYFVINHFGCACGNRQNDGGFDGCCSVICGNGILAKQGTYEQGIYEQAQKSHHTDGFFGQAMAEIEKREFRRYIVTQWYPASMIWSFSNNTVFSSK